ncbi:alpha/beta hydrolase, partial [Oscillibacter sp.]
MKIVELPVGGGNAVLTGYLLDASQEFANITARPAVLVLPGGGYALCSDREAEPIAMAYLAQGFHAFVLRYTVGTGFDPFPSALAEAEQALETLRSHAADWRLDPERVAAVGFSVGGHLAA